MIVIFLSHHILNPITHLKFRKNLHFLKNIRGWVLPSILIFDICSDKMESRSHLKIRVFLAHERGGFSNNSGILELMGRATFFASSSR